MELTHISLFAGIGGIDIASEWAGFKTILFVEIDKYCQKILKKHWPDVPIIGDIKDVKGNEWSATLITGGFPCQPFSEAGQQRGSDDERYLWPEMLRVISEIRPAWVVAENVAGIIRLALPDVLSDLESANYETQSYLIPACAINAYHRRNRIFIVAHTAQFRYDNPNIPSSGTNSAKEQALRKRYNRWDETNRCSQVEDGIIKGVRMEDESAVLPLVYGLASRLVNPQIKACGNAVVPQQIYPILKAIADIEA